MEFTELQAKLISLYESDKADYLAFFKNSDIQYPTVSLMFTETEFEVFSQLSGLFHINNGYTYGFSPVEKRPVWVRRLRDYTEEEKAMLAVLRL